MAKSKRSADANVKAFEVTQIATCDISDSVKAIPEDELLKAAAVVLERKGCPKGGKARAKILSEKRRIEIAKKAAKARWHKK